jgi:hypothetical protein
MAGVAVRRRIRLKCSGLNRAAENDLRFHGSPGLRQEKDDEVEWMISTCNRNGLALRKLAEWDRRGSNR